MSVLVDTPIWSFAYRRSRRSKAEQRAVDALGSLIHEDWALMLGAVRQEVLCGFTDPDQFPVVRATLRAFYDVEVGTLDYERAADFSNTCRRRGVQGSSTDFLICAVAVRLDAEVFTTDRDFTRYAKLIGVELFDYR